MKSALIGAGEPRRWGFQEALREKRKLTDTQIEEIFRTSTHLDLVELAMAIEEEFDIEIKDDDFLGLKGHRKDSFES